VACAVAWVAAVRRREELTKHSVFAIRKSSCSSSSANREQRAENAGRGGRGGRGGDAGGGSTPPPITRFELVAGQTLADLQLSADERYVWVGVTQQPQGPGAARGQETPNYVTESSYPEMIPGRTNVGDVQSRRLLAILDLQENDRVWADARPAATSAKSLAIPIRRACSTGARPSRLTTDRARWCRFDRSTTRTAGTSPSIP
jgi:hypothetical protein